MNLDILNEREKEIIIECLNAVVNGPFIPKSLFHTLMGFERDKLIEFVNNWDGQNAVSSEKERFIYMALFQLLEYPHDLEHVWSEYISMSKNNVAKILHKISGVDVPLNKKLNGIIQGYLTPAAQKLWDTIDKKKQVQILTNVWCPHCNRRTVITNYEGGVDDQNRISLYGNCSHCFMTINKKITIER